MPTINHRTKFVFQDRLAKEAVRRSFSYDELTLVGFFLGVAVQPGREQPPTFRVEDVLSHLRGYLEDCCSLEHYARPTVEVLHRMVAKGFLAEVPVAGVAENPLGRAFVSVRQPTIREWAMNAVALTAGLPYVGHVYSDVVVRVHSEAEDRTERIGSGIVVLKNKVLTNAHVISGERNVRVSWGESDCQAVNQIEVHPEPQRHDLAILTVENFEAQPVSWLRPPCLLDQVAVLAYSAIPRVLARPLVATTGEVSTAKSARTFFGEEHVIVSAVATPGSSGGAVFASDGHLVGLVVEQLAGEYEGDEGDTHHAVFYAAIPADTLLREVPTFAEGFAGWNTFGGEDVRPI